MFARLNIIFLVFVVSLSMFGCSSSKQQETKQQAQSQNAVSENPSKQQTYDINSLDIPKEWSQNNEKFKMEENNKIYMIKYPNQYILYKGKIDGEYVYSYSTNAPDADVPQREYLPICTLYVSASADKLKIKAVSDTPKVTEDMYFTYNKSDKFIYNKTYDDDPLLHPDEINNIHGVVLGCTLSFKSHNYVKIFGHSKATRLAEKLDRGSK